MHFLSVIKNNTTPGFAATMFIEDLINAISLDIEVVFIQECLKSIGLELDFNEEDIENGFENYDWPKTEIRKYSFEYNPYNYKPVEEFLMALGSKVISAQATWSGTSQQENCENTPIHYFLQLMAAWYTANESLTTFERENCIGQSYLEAPLSRIDFCLLQGLHDLRKHYGSEFDSLNAACHRFFQNSILGLYFMETNKFIGNGLLTIFENDFHYFYNHSKCVVVLYHKLLIIEGPVSTYLLTYKSLTNMLLNQEYQMNITHLLTYLVTSDMKNIYYTMLKQEKGERLLMQLLKFLKVLQSKLLSVDCFSEAFVEQFLALVLRKNDKISNAACELYILMMKRQKNDDYIFRHIIDFYLRGTDSIDSIDNFFNCIVKHFPYMKDVNTYLRYLSLHFHCVAETDLIIMMVHFLKSAFNFLNGDNEHRENRAWYVEFLRNLTETLRCALPYEHCIPVIGILMEIYDIVDFGELSTVNSDFETLLFAIDSFLSELFSSRIDFPFEATLPLWLETKYLKEISAPHIVNVLIRDFSVIENKIRASEKTNFSLLKEYRNVLMKLVAILKFEEISVSRRMQAIRLLSKSTFEEENIFEIEKNAKLFIDCFAINALTYAIFWKASKVDQYEMNRSTAGMIEKLLIKKLPQVEAILDMPIFRIQTFVCRLMELYVMFKQHLKLNRTTYDLLMHIISVSVFNKSKEPNVYDNLDNETICHPKRLLDYQSAMLRGCDILHECQSIPITGHSIYKICIYYGTNHPHNELLKRLLITLYKKHFDVYKRVIPVIIYNLYRMQPALNAKITQNCIKCHRGIVDEIDDDNRSFVKFHMVLAVIELTGKFLKIIEPNKDIDRVSALRHLPLWLENLDVIDRTAIELVLKALDQLQSKKYLLPHEMKTFKKFLTICENK